MAIAEEILIPQQIQQVLGKLKNKENTTYCWPNRSLSGTSVTVFVSSMAVSNKVIKAQVQEEIGSTDEVTILSSWQE